jgi:hypothetical protein
MNNAIRTRFDVNNKGEDPLTPPQSDVIDLNNQEDDPTEEEPEPWCGGQNGWDNYVERWH